MNIIELDIMNFDNTVDFYKDLLKFTLEEKFEEEEVAIFSKNEAKILVQKSEEEMEYPAGIGVTFQFEVENIDEINEALLKEEYPLLYDLEENWFEDESFGTKELMVMDPSGYKIRLIESL